MLYDASPICRRLLSRFRLFGGFQLAHGLFVHSRFIVMFRQIDVGAAEAGGLPDVVEPKVDIRTYDIVSLEGRVPLESQKKREAHGHENLEATAVGEIVQAPEHPESDRYEEEHRGDVVAVFEDELQGDYGPLHEVIQDEEQNSE